MLSFDFENELLEAVEKALQGSGIKPVYVLGKIAPVIEKHANQQSVQSDGGVCTCKKPIATTSTNNQCGCCGKPRRR